MAIARPKAYEKIKLAIIQQAIEDYKEALKRKKKKKIAELEEFFKSQWGENLTFGNGEYIIRKIKDEIGVD